MIERPARGAAATCARDKGYLLAVDGDIGVKGDYGVRRWRENSRCVVEMRRLAIRLGAREEPLLARGFDRVGKLDHLRRHAGGLRDRATAEALVEIIHHVEPYRRRTGDTRHVVHRGAGEISDPYANRKAAGVADAPVVAHVLAGAGFDGAPKARRERILQAERGRTARAIGEDVGNQKRGRWRVDLPRGLLRAPA